MLFSYLIILLCCRNHNLGLLPWNEANKIPTLSHWISDVIPFYPCCLWQEEQSVGCQRYRFERRASQDCVGYQPPGGGMFSTCTSFKYILVLKGFLAHSYFQNGLIPKNDLTTINDSDVMLYLMVNFCHQLL